MIEVFQIPVLTDNYIYIIRDLSSSEVAVVDPALADPVLEFLEKKKWKLSYIINTHHHFDHVGGNLEIKSKTGCKIFGSKYDQHRIPGIDIQLDEKSYFKLGNSTAKILYIPGHTLGHIAYYFEEDQKLFSGDTLFAMGCGRLFEGTPSQMLESLTQIKNLNPLTLIYCTHEYTLKNGEFALTVDRENPLLIQRMEQVRSNRNQSLPTVPTTLQDELNTNPFLRPHSPDIQQAVKLIGATTTEVFTKLRGLRDSW